MQFANCHLPSKTWTPPQLRLDMQGKIEIFNKFMCGIFAAWGSHSQPFDLQYSVMLCHAHFLSLNCTKKLSPSEIWIWSTCTHVYQNIVFCHYDASLRSFIQLLLASLVG
jgi:hypothetical protein